MPGISTKPAGAHLLFLLDEKHSLPRVHAEELIAAADGDPAKIRAVLKALEDPLHGHVQLRLRRGRAGQLIPLRARPVGWIEDGKVSCVIDVDLPWWATTPEGLPAPATDPDPAADSPVDPEGLGIPAYGHEYHDGDWSRMVFLSNGHRYYRYLDGDLIGVADSSGDGRNGRAGRPHATDDGVLWLDPTRTLRVLAYDDVHVPLLRPLPQGGLEQVGTVADLFEGALVSEKFGKPLVVNTQKLVPLGIDAELDAEQKTYKQVLLRDLAITGNKLTEPAVVIYPVGSGERARQIRFVFTP